MDLTTTCPTCGHTEDASLKTCSFCGVDLGRYSEPKPDVKALDTTAVDEYPAEAKSAAAGAELMFESPSTGKPESVDEAIAHVLSAEPIMDLVEEVESDEKIAPSELGSKRPEETESDNDAEANSVPAERLVEDDTSETIVLPESVQLRAEESTTAAGEPADQAPPGDTVSETAEDSKKESLKIHRAALAKAEALKKHKMAVAREAALKKKKMALNQMPPMPSSIRIQKLLKPYHGKTIGINFDNSAIIAAADLVAVNSEYLTVLVKPTQLRYHFPLKTILSVIEGVDGKGVPTGANNEVFNAVIKIYPLVLF